MTEPWGILEWDSNFFGFRIARLFIDILTEETVQKVDGWCHQNQIKCVYFLANSNDAETTIIAENHGFHFVDIRLTFKFHSFHDLDIRDIENTTQFILRNPIEGDLPELMKIAGESYKESRFYFDANFPKPLSQLMYQTWIDKSCKGYADNVIVAEVEGIPVGYITCHKQGKDFKEGRIGLLGVGNNFLGQGLGRLLVLNSLRWFYEQNTDHVVVITQGRNIAAQRLYQKCGFLTELVQLWFHKWYRT